MLKANKKSNIITVLLLFVAVFICICLVLIISNSKGDECANRKQLIEKHYLDRLGYRFTITHIKKHSGSKCVGLGVLIDKDTPTLYPIEANFKDGKVQNVKNDSSVSYLDQGMMSVMISVTNTNPDIERKIDIFTRNNSHEIIYHTKDKIIKKTETWNIVVPVSGFFIQDKGCTNCNSNSLRLLTGTRIIRYNKSSDIKRFTKLLPVNNKFQITNRDNNSNIIKPNQTYIIETYHF